MTIKLGDEVRDKVTGFRGMVVAVTQWLNGCARMCVQPRKLIKGKPAESETFDEKQLEITKPAKHEPDTRTGGPRPRVERGQGTPRGAR